MNISPIMLNFLSRTTQTNNRFNNSHIIKPNSFNYLAQDTVSFSGRKKNAVDDEIESKRNKKDMDERWNSINNSLAIRLKKEAEPSAIELEKTLKKYLGNLVANDENPNRPIAPGKSGIKVRVKSENSICEKTATRELQNKQQVKDEMYDIIGARIVLRDASPEGVKLVIQKITEAVKNNDLKVFEIENYRSDPKLSYVPPKTLDTLVKAANKVRTNGVKFSESSIPSGYTALHLSVYLKDGFKGEIQIMGLDVQDVKEVEDFIYKMKNNKDLDPKYKEIQDTLMPIRDNKPLQRAVNAHSEEQYKAARLKEPKSAKTKHVAKFLPVPKYLPEEFDFGELYKKKLECDKRAIAEERIKNLK